MAYGGWGDPGDAGFDTGGYAGPSPGFSGGGDGGKTVKPDPRSRPAGHSSIAGPPSKWSPPVSGPEGGGWDKFNKKLASTIGRFSLSALPFSTLVTNPAVANAYDRMAKWFGAKGVGPSGWTYDHTTRSYSPPGETRGDGPRDAWHTAPRRDGGSPLGDAIKHTVGRLFDADRGPRGDFVGGGLPSVSGASGRAAGLYDDIADMSREQWDIWKQHGLGSLKRLEEKVRDYTSPGRIAAEEGLASANVEAAYDRERKGLIRSLQRQGVNPASGRFTAALRSLSLGRAADSAGARTETRRGILDRGLAHEANLARMWQPLAGSAMAGMSTAASGLGGLEMHDRSLANQRELALLGMDQRERLTREGWAHDMEMAKRGYSAQNKRDMWSAIGNIGGGALAWWLLSDRRLKTDIRVIDQFPNGLNVYEFRFGANPQLLAGLMADEVESLMPQHVVTNRAGFKMVDYAGVIREMIHNG